MKKTKLVIASVLKPVDDTRMYEKFGLSLSQTNKYAINIIGFYSKNNLSAANITFHPIFNFKRISLSRLLAPLRCFKKLLKIKPDILIVNTHELLFIAFVYKILFGGKLMYDVQENYFRNLLHTTGFPLLTRPLLAGYVRLKEYLSALFVDGYTLAEKSYEQEFNFSKGKSVVIENKLRPITVPPTSRNEAHITLLFTGTIAESTGVFEAIKLASGLHKIDQSVCLKIVGFCAKKQTLNLVKNAIKSLPFITLKGGDTLVPHIEIIAAIQQADFGIICYPENPSTFNSTPTKLYEYLGSHLPVIIQNHDRWKSIIEQYDAGITIDFEQTNYTELMQKLNSQSFYQNVDTTSLLWASEAPKLIKFISSI